MSENDIVGGVDPRNGNIVTQADAVQILEEYREVKLAKMMDNTQDLDVVLKRYDLVEAHYDPMEQQSSYILVADRNAQKNFAEQATGFPEMAFIDPSPFTAWTRLENISELRGKKGLRLFYDMSRSDGAVRGALRVVKTPIQGADWYMEPASEASIDKNIADFVQKTLMEDMETLFERFVEDCLRCIDYGYFVFEKVYYSDPKTDKIKINLTPIHPLDIQGWTYDGAGNVTGIRLEPIQGETYQQMVEIPFRRLLMVVFEMEGGDLRGTSILRTAYKHFYYKDTLYKIDAIQKERHGIGVPIIKLPMGFTDKDKDLANQLGRNLRTNERAYITIPWNWEVMFAKLEGQPVDTMPSIEHHDRKIYESILATFTGTKEFNQESLDTFYKSTRYMARVLAATINKYVVRELVDINFLRKNGYPKLCVRRMGEWEETRTMTFALRNLVGAQVLTPDLPLENLIRQLWGLPPLDEATARIMPTPAGGGLASPSASVKPPKVEGSKQKPSPPIGTPAKNAGSDKSGG